MTRRCELTGKLPLSGNIRSHAENATRRKFRPNLVNVTLISEVLDRQVKLRISRLCLEDGRAPRRPRCLPGESSRRGAFSEQCLKLKREIAKTKAERAVAAA